MEREGSKHLSLNDAYRFGAEQGFEPEVNEIRNMEIEWDRSYTSSLRRGFIAYLFEQKGILSLAHCPGGEIPPRQPVEVGHIGLFVGYLHLPENIG